MEPGVDTITGHLTKVRMAPGDTIDHGPHLYNLAHMAPPHADQLDPFNGFECVVLVMTIVDNAGRVWEVRPGAGKRPRLINWRTKALRRVRRR